MGAGCRQTNLFVKTRVIVSIRNVDGVSSCSHATSDASSLWDADIYFTLHRPQLLALVVHQKQRPSVGINQRVSSLGNCEHERIYTHIGMHGFDHVKERFNFLSAAY